MGEGSKKILLFLFIFSISFILFIPNSKSQDTCITEPDYSYVEGYWKLNETSGNTAYNSFGSVNGLCWNVEDTDWIDAKLGNGLKLNNDSANEWIMFGNLHSFYFSPSNPFSVEFWLWSDNPAVGATAIIGKHSNVFNRGWGLYTVFGIPVFAITDSTSNIVVYDATIGIPDSQWHHYVLTYDGNKNNNSMEIYRDGIKRPLTRSITGILNNIQSNTPFTAAWYAGNNLLFNKAIYDNIILYNTLLSEEEVIYQYNNTYGKEYYPDRQPPFAYNLTERFDPLSLGYNESIFIDIVDENNITDVYIEIDNTNYSMNYFEGNTWYYDDWSPTISGSFPYTIWMIDQFGNTNCLINSIKVFNSVEIILSFSVLLFLLIAMIYMFLKDKRFLIMLTILLFSVIFTFASLTITLFPYSPFLQVLFLFIQVILFAITTIEMNHKKR